MGNRNPKDNSDYGLKDFFEQVRSSIYKESTRADLKVLSALLLCSFIAVVVTNHEDIAFAVFFLTRSSSFFSLAVRSRRLRCCWIRCPT
jgi:hypothetical protein